MKTIEKNVQRIVDLEDIKILKHTYARHCDDNYNATAIAELFDEDGVWDGGPLGYAEGREAIKSHFENASNLIDFAFHSMSNPIIEVNGDEATGQWYLWQPMVTKPDNQALWLIARYENSFRRVNDVWKFRQLKCVPQALSPYEMGFGKMRFIETQSSNI